MEKLKALILQEMTDFAEAVNEQLQYATEFRIPCPQPADPGRLEGAPVLHPEALIIRRRLDGRGDGWLILNPNRQPGDQVWTGSEWVYRGELHRDVIYKWGRNEAITEAQRLAAAETERYEQWLTEQRGGRTAGERC